MSEAAAAGPNVGPRPTTPVQLPHTLLLLTLALTYCTNIIIIEEIKKK